MLLATGREPKGLALFLSRALFASRSFCAPWPVPVSVSVPVPVSVCVACLCVSLVGEPPHVGTSQHVSSEE